jgi:hypothetical protein
MAIFVTIQRNRWKCKKARNVAVQGALLTIPAITLNGYIFAS